MSVETVLITGASSGLGWDLAELFAASGSKLVLVARREEKLRELSKKLKDRFQTESIVISCDLIEPEAPQNLFDRLKSENVHIDVLVNNAGFGQLGRFSEIDLSRQLQMCQLNNQAMVHLTHLFLQSMIERQQGAILNVASTAAFQPGPTAAIYFATKSFVLSFSEAIWFELKRQGIGVTVLCPGPTETEFFEESHMGETLLARWNNMDSKKVALAGYRGLRMKRRLVVPGLINNILAWTIRITPRPWVLWMTRILQASKSPL